MSYVGGKQVYPKLSYAIPKGRRSGFTLGTGLYHTKDSSEKVSAQSVRIDRVINILELL